MTKCASSKPFDNSDASSVDTKIESEAFETSGHRFEQVHSLWFEDGNVVIIADTTSFRIHRSVLARHSDVLADRLGSDLGHRDVNTTDGCLVVRVADSSRSFKAFLSLLYPGPSE